MDSCEPQVACIFDKTNVWANTQSKRSPWLLSWDLQNHHLWQPFFSKNFPAQHDLGTVQPDIRWAPASLKHAQTLPWQKRDVLTTSGLVRLLKSACCIQDLLQPQPKSCQTNPWALTTSDIARNACLPGHGHADQFGLHPLM